VLVHKLRNAAKTTLRRVSGYACTVHTIRSSTFSARRWSDASVKHDYARTYVSTPVVYSTVVTRATAPALAGIDQRSRERRTNLLHEDYKYCHLMNVVLTRPPAKTSADSCMCNTAGRDIQSIDRQWAHAAFHLQLDSGTHVRLGATSDAPVRVRTSADRKS
jgi:hypothetical protein